MSTRRWKGDAVAIAQVTTIAVTGTWAAADTATLTINGKDVTVTIGSNTAVSDIVAAIVAAINAATATENLVNDESRNVGGQQIPEFVEVTAIDQNPNIALQGNTAGNPFTVTASESTAGTGALGSPTNSTAPTGPNHFDNADNWSGAAVPIAADDVVFDSGNVDCKHGLAQSAITLTSLTITNGYTGTIGLPEVNADGTDYREYRDQYLAISATTLNIGEDDGAGSGRLKLDVGSNACTLNVTGSGQAADDGIPAILWKGTHASNVANILKGAVGIAYFAGESATLATLRVGFLSDPAGDSTVECGDSVTLTNIEQSGGELTVDGATTAVVMTDGVLSALSGAHASISIDGGTCFYRSTGTLTTVNVGGGGELDFSRDMQSRTVTNCELSAGASLRDPFKTVTFTNGFDLYRCTVADLKELSIGNHLTLTPSAI